ncbi:MAG TPA: M48 family metallopeptidase [Chitinophagales bacterium]|nr:M48 family metallopeptidase [Chitinophagales bacterium]
MKKLILLFITGFAIACTVHAQGADSLATQTPAFNVDSATQHYLDMLTPAQKAKSDAYFEGGYWLLLWGTLYSLLVAGIFLLTGLSKWMKGLAARPGRKFVEPLIYIPLYILISWVLSFPLSVYQDFYREHQYGLSNMTFSAWLTDGLKGLAIGLVFGSIIGAILYSAIRAAGKTWWLWASGISIVFVGFIVFITPVFLAPIFNKYEPLAPGELKNQILSMARANEIPADNVYQFNASKQSDRISANVSGFGSTTRISLNDNLLKRCTPAEIRSVMGHEMGHYVMNHVYKGLFEMSVLLVIMFALANWLFNLIIARYPNLGITSIGDVAGLPLLAAIFTVMSFFFTPVTNTMTRTQEAEADMFGLNAAREPDGEAHVDIMLSEYRKLDPGKWEEIIFYDHPSGRNRVHMAMQWKAEHLHDCK